MDFIVETSARHIHLTDAAIEALYGPGATLGVKKMLSQPGQFACTNDKIKLVGPKGELMVSVLGPARKACQVELSFTDARTLGLKDVPVRESGDVAGTPGIHLVGPAGELDIAEGCIIAKRHVHMTPADAAAFGVTNGLNLTRTFRSLRSGYSDAMYISNQRLRRRRSSLRIGLMVSS